MPDIPSQDEVVIKVRRDGPYKVSGPARLVDADGREIPVAERPFVLCRCGRSQTQPFCDRSHAAAGGCD